MAILLKAIYRFNAIPTKNPNVILCRNRKFLNSKSNPKQKKVILEVSEYWTSNYTTSHSNKRNIVWAQKQT
jgi:hypothetical protein